MRHFSGILLLLLLGVNLLHGQIDSQWRGPNRDGIYPGEKLLQSWPAHGPRQIWSAEDLGIGYSSAAVTKDRVYITGMIDGEGFLFAFDHNGSLLWKSSYGPEWDGGHEGARTTPTVVGDRIYLYSGEGHAVCLSTAGKVLWSVNTFKAFGGRNLHWGITESLLVDGDRLFCTPGGPDVLMAVLDRHSGKTLQTLRGNGELSAYCSPALVKHGGRRLILTMTGKSLVGLDADSGEFLWDARHITRYDINPNTPLYFGGRIFSQSGYGTGCQMFQLAPDGTSVKRIWENEEGDSQMAAAVLIDGHLYTSGHSNRGWACLDWETGETQWQSRDLYGKGPVVFSDGKIYLYSEKGDVALVNPDPARFDVVSSFKISRGSGPHWAHPVIRDGRLYIRHGEVLMVYDIAAE